MYRFVDEKWSHAKQQTKGDKCSRQESWGEGLLCLQNSLWWDKVSSVFLIVDWYVCLVQAA